MSATFVIALNFVLLAGGGQSPKEQAPSGRNSGMANQSPPGPSAEKSNEVRAPAINVKETAPARIAFLEHTGPYWGTGALVAQVERTMNSIKEAGPLFVEFPEDPRSVAQSELRSRIGFVLQGNREPGIPFVVERRPSRIVAYLLASGAVGTTFSYHAELYQWAQVNGYEPIGPICEQYWVGRKPFEREVVEIQLGVRKTPVASTSPKELDAPIAGPQGAPAIGESGPKIERPALEPSPVQKPAKEVLTAQPTDDAADSDTSDSAGSLSIEHLYSRGELQTIAEIVVPTAESLRSDEEAWLGELILRMAALERGLDREEIAESTEGVRDLIAAVRIRFETTRRGSKPPSATPVISLSVGAWGDELRRREIMQDMDRLLGRVAMQALNPEDARDEFIAILKRVARLSVHRERPPE